MSKRILSTILTIRGWSELPCARSDCNLNKSIQVGDVVSNGVHATKTKHFVKIYHEACYDSLPPITPLNFKGKKE